VFFEHPHIDTVLALVPGKQNVMVVDPYYYEDNKRLLKKIAKETNHKIVKIAKSEAHLLPANLINLPDGRVLINKAPRLRRQLEKYGAKVIMMDRPIKANPLYMMGGLRCMTMDFMPTKEPEPPKPKKIPVHK